MSATIVFRGLMVFHYFNNFMEIGLIDGRAHAAGGPSHVAHIPRIIKTKNGVISSIFDLRTRPELGNVREWEIEVSHPLQDTVTKFEHGATFNRLTHPELRDYRWIADFEASDLHNKDLTTEVDTSSLMMVLKVQHGEFYTQQLSKPLVRTSVIPAGANRTFGMAAEVTGCDIAFERGTVRLMVDDTVAYNFDEQVEDGVIYEFSNAPADVDPHAPYPVNGAGHFSMYYSHLFKRPLREQFNLLPEEDLTPSPDPALCGASALGLRGGGL